MLQQLLRNEAGNIMALTAAATLPMLAVIGGAVDISRVYLTKSRIQAACDSAVLAGRKAMPAAIYTDAAKARARSMFNFNFQDADYGTNTTSFVTSADVAGKVSGTAKTTLPMVIMGMFGAKPYKLTVNCSADVQVPNIDVVLVLDVTGSMDESISGTKKIDALKSAAKDFYTTLQTAMVGNTQSQLRYGFVPYSQAVNVKDLFKSSPNTLKGEAPLSNLIDSMEVESRVANFNTAVTEWAPDSSSTPTTLTQIFNKDTAATKEPFLAQSGTGSNVSTYDCDQYGSNLSFTIDSSPNVWLYPRTSWPGGEAQGDSVLYQKDGSGSWLTSEPTDASAYYYKLTFSRVTNPWSDGNKYSCTRQVTKTKYIKQTKYKLTNWTLKPLNLDVSAFKSGTAINYLSDPSTLPTDFSVDTAGSFDMVALRQLAGLTGKSTTWDGCIEERTTTAVSTFAPIPAAAKDLNYVDGGTSDTLRWRPVLRDITWNRKQTAQRTVNTSDLSNYPNPGYTCPTARIRNLNVMTKTEFDTYIDGLSPGGNTYLDVGMIWGLRLINPQGMFASRNLTGPNGGQISRHIIFLTDGEPAEASSSYTAYGVEDVSKRVAGTTGTGLATLHARRFQALCDAQRGAVSIWAIAFGTAVGGNLSSCADPGRAYQANNTTELRNAFRSIAQEVADLRLVQ